MFKRAFTPIFILIALVAAAWGQGGSRSETAELDIIIRDFSAPANSLNERNAAGYTGYYGFQEYDYSKSTATRECNPNGATKGMVRDTLDYSQCERKIQEMPNLVEKAATGRYCARPMPANPAPAKMCYGEYLQNWYTNVKEAKVFNEVMTLTCDNNGLCKINDDAYFPLDKYLDSETWGKQNTDGNRTAHNYGFTVAGSGEFKYVAANNDNFAFKGDDDMWIFIDGVLVIDIGGVHNEVRDSIAMNDIAKARGWADGTMHTINFFYAERQTSSSHLQLTFRLTDLQPSQFGAPAIKRAETTINENGEGETFIWVSTKLNLESIEQFIGSDQFPIIIIGSNSKDVSGYKLSSIEFKEADGTNGYKYLITGSVCDTKNSCNSVISGGDSLSFNVKRGDLIDDGYRDPNGFALPSDSWYIKSSIGMEARKVDPGPNTTKMQPIAFEPIPGDHNPVKPDFSDVWFTGNPKDDGNCTACLDLPSNGTFPNIKQIWDPIAGDMVPIPTENTKNTKVRGFGTKGTPIPPQRAGELILTAFPSANGMVNTAEKGKISYEEWKEDEELQKLFGMPPEQSDRGPYGIADPKTQATDGGYTFVKNGFPKESSVGGSGQIAPTRCVADRTDPKNPRINCLNFSLLAKQPFQLSVILYDQLGNFVTQYRETVTEQEFRSVVQGANNVPEEQANIKRIVGTKSLDDNNLDTSYCKLPTSGNYGQPNVLTTNGLVKVNVNIYPFSRDGRRFGNGVYIAKIDRVDLPYHGCLNNGGQAVRINEDYMRYHAEQKFGWMRAKSSKK